MNLSPIDFRESVPEPTDLVNFCVGWQSRPSPSKLRDALAGSHKVICAYDGSRMIGFINSLSDGVLSSYIPLLEVLPEYQGLGIGTQLLKRMLIALEDHYMVDLLCDASLAGFYEREGMTKIAGMAKRNFAALARSGEGPAS